MAIFMVQRIRRAIKKISPLEERFFIAMVFIYTASDKEVNVKSLIFMGGMR